MAGREEDTVGGYNEFLHQHRGEDCLVTTALFDDCYEILYDGVPAEAASLQREQYWVRGTTALYDAIGRTIMTVGTRHSRRKKKDRPHTFLVIITDGYENASREYGAQKIREMLERQQKKHGWEVLFFGCEVEAALAAQELPIPETNVFSVSAKEDEDYFQDLLQILNRRI